MSLGKKSSDFGYELGREEIGLGYEGLGQEELGFGYENG
jgi:hypothetical protein